MAKIELDDHESLRLWCTENKISDPEGLVARNKYGSVVFRSANAGKSYRRIEKMYQEAKRSEVP
ncbi:MAG: hypothetical protein EHM14_00400 [Methanothrix sp.]|nr:MAG: hypothetical protein EHM14_00400 [Methanothrix sp.]